MKVNSKCQVTIPINLRQQYEIGPGSEVEFITDGDQIVLRKKATATGRGRQLIEAMLGKGSINMTTAEIMTLTRGSWDPVES